VNRFREVFAPTAIADGAAILPFRIVLEFGTLAEIKRLRFA
jgi:hypothetical protein